MSLNEKCLKKMYVMLGMPRQYMHNYCVVILSEVCCVIV